MSRDITSELAIEVSPRAKQGCECQQKSKHDILQNAVAVEQRSVEETERYKCCTSSQIKVMSARSKSNVMLIHNHPSDTVHLHAPSPQIPNTPIANPTPLTPHLTNSIHCWSLARLSTSSPLTSSTFSFTTPCFNRVSIAKFKLPLAAATRPVQSRYGCRVRAGLRAKAASRETLASVESVRMCRVARRVVCARV
jgi:hypothetical protein